MNQPREVVADALPELPAHKGCLYLHNTGSVSQVWGYTADQMREYAVRYAAWLATQPGASAGGEERARELLAVEYERDGKVITAKCMREGRTLCRDQDRALRALAAALRAPAKTGGEAGSA